MSVSWGHPRFGSIIATCGLDKKVIIWKETTSGNWEEAVSFDFQSAVNCVSFGPAEKLWLAVCCADGNIAIIERGNNERWEKVA